LDDHCAKPISWDVPEVASKAWGGPEFPWDFDGIVAGGPALRITRVGILWNARALNDSAGKPILGKAELETLHRAVIGKCDLNDGIKDRLIGDPRRCDLKPESLLCSRNKPKDA